MSSIVWVSADPARRARQLVNHAHFSVNGKTVNVPSYIVKAGDVIAVRKTAKRINTSNRSRP